MDDNDDPSMTLGKRWFIAVSVAMIPFLFLSVMIMFALEPGSQFYLGRSKSLSRIPLDRTTGLGIVFAFVALFLFLLIRWLLAGMRQAKLPSLGTNMLPTLPASELVRWTGRPGWRSFRGPRVLGAALVIGIPALLTWWLWSIWSGANPFLNKVFFSLFPLFLILGSVFPGIVSLSDYLHSWLCDVFGEITITERRIVWTTPWKRGIYRQIVGTEIVDAYISSINGTRGAITIIKRKGKDVEHIYFDGIPKPESALAALAPLLRQGE